jgi:hypothetical protein
MPGAPHLDFEMWENMNVSRVPHLRRFAPFANRLRWDRTNLDPQVLYQGAAFSRAENRLETNGALAPGM